MRKALVLALLAVAGGTLALRLAGQQEQKPPVLPTAGQQPPGEQQPTIRRNVELVDVVFSVVNRRQKFVTDLGQADFRVFEDGQEQTIRFFSRQTELPLRVALLLDTSNSIRERLNFEQEAAVEFLYNVIRRKKDQAFLMTFDDEPAVIRDYTDDVGLLRDAIMKERAGGGTALYDAVYDACEQRLMNPPLPADKSPEMRRVLVVISDGDDTQSKHTRGEAAELAQRAGVTIYAISSSTQWVSAEEETDENRQVSRKWMMGPGDKTMQQLAEETGGRAFFPYRVDDLGQSFQDIGDELRSQYSLAYTPNNQTPDGKFRRIQIRLERKELKDLAIRARRGYYAPRSSADFGAPPPKAPGQ